MSAPTRSGTTRSMPSSSSSRSGHQRPAPRRASATFRVARGDRDDPRGRGAVEHPEVPVAPRRAPRLGVEHEVVVGELDRGRAPTRERLAHRDLELPAWPVLVVQPHPRVGDGRERVGVVHEVRRVGARGVVPRRDRAIEGRVVRRPPRARPRSPRTRAVRRTRGSSRDHPRPRPRWSTSGGRWRGSQLRPQNSRRSTGAPARSSSRSISTHSMPRLCANTRAWGLMRVATNIPRVGARLASRSRRSW